MVERVASCRCGALTATCRGEPVRVSVCHCHDCQKRSGSAFAAQARFPADQVTLTGEPRVWKGSGGSGAVAAFHFCPTCGCPLYYRAEAEPDLLAIALGAFADNTLPAPNYSVYESRRHPWVAIVGEGIDRY